MRTLLVLGALVGCDATVASRAQAIVGGADDPGDPAVVALVVAGGQCSGVVVAPRVVVTAAHCALPGVGRTDGIADFGPVAPSGQTARIVALWIDRGYVGDVDHDLAAVRLDRDAPATVVIGSASPGAAVRLVGYGASAAGAAATRGVRRQVAATIAVVSARHVVAGGAGATTCTGDSGGAALDPGGAVVGLVSAGDDACTAPAQLVRPDSEPQLAEVIAAWSGPCPADTVCDAACPGDPDCDPCAYQGACDPACVHVDLDCPLAGGAGATCVGAVDCESRRCEAAPEGAGLGAFCSAACQLGADCPPPLGACQGGVCVYPGATPGIAGAECHADGDCRSGLCDLAAGVCAVPCDPSGACPAGLACLPVRDGAACTRSAGCAAGGGGQGTGWIVLGLVLVRRRRLRG
jgi:hypothetical protein